VDRSRGLFIWLTRNASYEPAAGELPNLPNHLENGPRIYVCLYNANECG
jgi:hypothetical protein